MANAALVITNRAAFGTALASSQELTMPIARLLTAQPSQRWRSLAGTASVVFDKGAVSAGDTNMLGSLTCGVNSTMHLRLSTSDASGVSGDAYDSGSVPHGDPRFDVNYGMFLSRLAAPVSYRYVRYDLTDPDAAYVEAGSILEGLAEAFAYNFIAGASIQWTDRSRVEKASSGLTLTWPDNNFRTISLSFDFIQEAQRRGLLEQFDRDKGLISNVLLMTDTNSPNLPQDSVYGLSKVLAPFSYLQAVDATGRPLFGKQLSIEERV